MESSTVEEHKKMLILSGKLSDFQLKNLKSWPFVVFDNISDIMIDYDFGSSDMMENPGKVTYTIIKKDKEKNEDKLDMKRETLAKWVKFLFWNETEVTVKYGN